MGVRPLHHSNGQRHAGQEPKFPRAVGRNPRPSNAKRNLFCLPVVPLSHRTSHHVHQATVRILQKGVGMCGLSAYSVRSSYTCVLLKMCLTAPAQHVPPRTCFVRLLAGCA